MKMSDLKTDLVLEENGSWVDYDETTSFKIARLGNPAFRARYDHAIKPHRRQIQQKTFSDAKLESILLDVMAETVLLDWKGLVDDAGNEVLFTKAKAREYLEIRDFREWITGNAGEMENFKAEADAADTKN